MLLSLPDELFYQSAQCLSIKDLRGLWCVHSSLVHKCPWPFHTHEQWRFEEFKRQLAMDPQVFSKYTIDILALEDPSYVEKFGSVPRIGLILSKFPKGESKLRISPTLKQFSCSESDFPDNVNEQLRECPLEYLSISTSGNSLSLLANMKHPHKLKRLNIRMSDFTPALSKLLSKFASLKSFMVLLNNQTQVLIPPLPKWPCLKEIGFIGSRWKLAPCGDPKDLPMLESLHLRGSEFDVTDWIGAHASKLKRLTCSVFTLYVLLRKSDFAYLEELMLTRSDESLVRSQLANSLPRLKHITVVLHRNMNWQPYRKQHVMADQRMWVWEFKGEEYSPFISNIEALCSRKEIESGLVSVDSLVTDIMDWISDSEEEQKTWSSSCQRISLIKVKRLVLFHSLHFQINMTELARFIHIPLNHVQTVQFIADQQGGGFVVTQDCSKAFSQMFPNAKMPQQKKRKRSQTSQ